MTGLGFVVELETMRLAVTWSVGVVGAFVTMTAGGVQAATKGQQIKLPSETVLNFTLQAPITRRLKTEAPAERPRARWWLGAIIFQFFSAIYGGYFGAGNGILMLAAMGLLGLSDIHRANGIKNFLGICINFIAIIGFTIAGLVYWPDALFMAVAAIAGGYFGASSARRLGRVFVRRAVVLIGLTIGIVMLWRLGR